MAGVLKELKDFIAVHREWIMLPLLVMLIFLTIVIIFNRNVIHVPFVYSGF